MLAAQQTNAGNAQANAIDVSDVSVMLPAGFRLQSGEKLSRPELRLRIFGEPSRPLIAVAGGISAGRAVADGGEENGWWREIVAPGGAIDLDRHCVVGFDFLPNPRETARTITSLDQARALGVALDKIGTPALKAFVGASYGGMVALAFAAAFPRRIEKLCIVSAADRAHPAATALRGVQRRIVEFAQRAGAPEEGVSLARQLAMISYRTPEEFAARFRCGAGGQAGDPYDVCRYLIARGNAYAMTPERYVTLSDSIDRHQVDPRAIAAASLFIAAQSDRLVPIEDVERLAASIANSRFHAFPSLYGHDAFLKEAATIGPVIKSFIEEASI